MPNITPYINFVNKSQAAVERYKTVFGGDAEVQLDGDRVIQLEFKADTVHFMGADLPDDQFGRQTSLVLNCDSEEQLRDLYSKLVEGGTSVFEPTDSGWGAIVAHCSDEFGVTWMLNYDQPQS